MNQTSLPAQSAHKFRGSGTVILLPTILAEDGFAALPEILRKEAESCEVFFVEELRTARRFLRKLIPGFDIDNRTWHATDLKNPDTATAFRKALTDGRTIGIMSEAGCPGVADPGQELVAIAQQMGAKVRPVTGPSSILLALMGSGMNGQLFKFNGYLPVDSEGRKKALRELEQDSIRTGCTHIFIETPYRNDAMLEGIIAICRPETRVCIAVNITGTSEDIRTKRVSEWKKEKPSLHKTPVIFLISAR